MDRLEAFRILETQPTASHAEIRKAYMDLVQVWHPDRFVGDPRIQAKASDKLALINEAYSCLAAGPGTGPEDGNIDPPDHRQQAHPKSRPADASRRTLAGWAVCLAVLILAMIAIKSYNRAGLQGAEVSRVLNGKTWVFPDEESARNFDAHAESIRIAEAKKQESFFDAGAFLKSIIPGVIKGTGTAAQGIGSLIQSEGTNEFGRGLGDFSNVVSENYMGLEPYRRYTTGAQYGQIAGGIILGLAGTAYWWRSRRWRS